MKERLQMSIQTVKDNIKILESQEPEDAGYYLQLEHEKMVLDALEKRLPTKPYTRDLWELGTAEGYSCPSCGYDFPVSYFEPYCCKCGQAIKYKHKDHPTKKGGAE